MDGDVIWFYRILFLPLLVLALPYYLRRMLRRGGYGRDFSHRFGFLPAVPKAKGKRRIWLHAVSVGELLSVEKLVQDLAATGIEVALTTTTSTGYALAKERFAPHCVAVGYFPIDFAPCNALAWKRLQPDAIVCIDSDLWPEHLHRARQRGVPTLLLNARLSDRSFRRYQKLGFAVRMTLHKLIHVLAATEPDYRRFKDLGIPEARLTLAGNLKFDKELSPKLSAEEKVALLCSIFPDFDEAHPPLILLGSSTWPGEETALAHAYQQVRKAGIDARLLLVPRHAERREAIRADLEKTGLAFHFRTEAATPPAPVPVYVADTTGELVRFTQAADLVFVGKSLFQSEGQSPVEAAAAGQPLLFGPGMGNFRAIAAALIEKGAAEKVSDANVLTDAILQLCQNADRRKAMGEAAAAFHATMRGATQRAQTAIEKAVEGLKAES